MDESLEWRLIIAIDSQAFAVQKCGEKYVKIQCFFFKFHAYIITKFRTRKVQVASTTTLQRPKLKK